MRVTYTHGSRLKFMKKVFVACVSLMSPSRLLPSHPSLLFLYIHFDITFQSTILPYFPVLKAQDTGNSAPASRSLATWPSQMQTQVMSPTSSTRILPWMMTRPSSTIPTTISPTSRKPRGRTLREGFVISAAESMSKNGKRNGISVSLKSHRKSCSEESLRKFYSDGWDLREHHERRAQQAILGENSIQRKLYSTEYNMEIQNSERRNSEYALFESQRELESQRQQLLEANQIKLNVREYICVADWGWMTIFVKNAMQEVAEILKNWKDAAIKKEKYKKQRRLEEFPVQHDQESRTVSLFFYDLDLLSSYDVPTFLIDLWLPRVQESLAAKLECCEIHERIWVFLETFLIVNMLTRDPEELYNDSRNLATPSGIADDVEDSEKRRNWE